MKIVRVIISCVLVFCILFTIFIGAKKIVQTDKLNQPSKYKGIITLWHVDGFEGGIGSRKQFLLKVARQFEKKNSGVLVMVINHTFTSVKENFDKGIYPDLISFSNGVEVNGLIRLNTQKSVNSVKVGDKTFATAWCRGGYVLITNNDAKNQDNSVIVSLSEYTQPLIAMQLEKLNFEQIKVYKPMDAYVNFVQGKIKYFLGTQRDVVRLKNRGFSFESTPIKKFNDLYQYIGLLTKNAEKQIYATKFIEYLISDEVQGQLNNLCMFSPYIKTDYEDSHLKAMQNVNAQKSISAYMHKEALKEMQEVSKLALNGDKNAINKIKNILI